MKLFAFVLLSGALLSAGCESMSTRMAERFSKVPPHTRVYAADQRTVYFAAQLAVKNAGLLLGRTSIAEWVVNGYAPIRTGNATRDARQTTIEIRLFETEALETRVEVLVWDHTEGSFPGGVSEQALREHGFYESYFAALQQVLTEKGGEKSREKP